MEYLRQAAEFVRQGVSSFQTPHLTEWVVTGTGGSTVSLDVGDVATLGATYVLPINVNVSAGKCEIALRHRTANLRVVMDGDGGGSIPGMVGNAGVGASVGIGWSLAPISGSYAGGALPTQADGGMNLPSGGIGCLVAGPRATAGGVIAPQDLEGILTIATNEVSFGPNGLSGGVALFADRPILQVSDLIFIKAFSLIWGVQFVGGSVGISAGAMVFRSKIRESSLPFPGARFGASVA